MQRGFMFAWFVFQMEITVYCNALLVLHENRPAGLHAFSGRGVVSGTPILGVRCAPTERYGAAYARCQHPSIVRVAAERSPTAINCRETIRTANTAYKLAHSDALAHVGASRGTWKAASLHREPITSLQNGRSSSGFFRSSQQQRQQPAWRQQQQDQQQ